MGKKTELSKCLCWTGCRSFWLLTGLCVEATIHCKDQAKWTRSFRFFSRFLSLFLCIVTRGVKYEASTRLRERFYKETKRMMRHGIGGGGTATETASRMNSIQMNRSSWHQNSVRKQSRPIVKKRDLIRDTPRIPASVGAAAKLQMEKNCLCRCKQTFLWRQTQFVVLMEKGRRLLELI